MGDAFRIQSTSAMLRSITPAASPLSIIQEEIAGNPSLTNSATTTLHRSSMRGSFRPLCLASKPGMVGSPCRLKSSEEFQSMCMLLDASRQEYFVILLGKRPGLYCNQYASLYFRSMLTFIQLVIMLTHCCLNRPLFFALILPLKASNPPSCFALQRDRPCH